MKTSKLLIVLIMIFVLGKIMQAQSPKFDSRTLETYLKVINHNKGFNGEILISNGHDIIFQKSIGMASFENNIQLENGAKYRIASITKTFTGTLIAIAQEEQKLNVHDRVNDYLIALSPKFKDITILQLLKHSSGLPHNEGIKDYWRIKSKLQMTPEQVIKEINGLDLLFEPGSKMKYSSLGYYLLASILENVYKSNFEVILQDKILSKLQMKETNVADNLKILPKMTSGYHLIKDDSLVVAPYRNFSLLKGAGDLYATSSDLLKWNNSFYSNTLLTQKTQDIIFEKSDHPIAKNGDHYGYGWYLNSDTPKSYYHGGGTWGYSTFTSMYPDSQTSIIILSNISALPISSIALDVEKIVFGKPFRLPSIEEVSKKPEYMSMYSGKFIADGNQMILSIINFENRLYAKLGRNPPFEIYPKTNHRFYGKKVDVEFTFEMNETNLVTGLLANGMGKSLQFKKADN